MAAPSPYCTPTELREKLARGDEFLLLDVRTTEEWQIARIDGARLIPMDAIRNSLDLLEEHLDGEIVVMCHHGVRSAAVCGFLRSQGFEDVHNLEGGIDAWSSEVDPSVPLY